MKKITVSTPGKLMLFGEHAVVFGKPCLVTAIDRRMYVMAGILKKEEFELDAPDVQVEDYRKPISEVGKGDTPRGARFVETAVKIFLDKIKSPPPPLAKGGHESTLIKNDSKVFPSLLKRGQGRFIKGVKITTKSDFSSQVGFGSSAAVTVGTIKAVAELFGIELSAKEIFDLAYKTVIDVQGRGSGFDVAASVYGGTLYFVTRGKTIEPLDTPYLPLIVGYSGVKADTVSIVTKVKESFIKRPDRLKKIYNDIGLLVDSAKDSLLKKDWEKLGALMNKNQEYLRELGVSSDKLDKMIESSIVAGAYGAKLSGAGGGDCIIALAPEEKKVAVEEAIKKARGEIIRVKTNAEGVRLE